MLHASFPRSVTLTQLRFTSFAVINLRRDLHPQECAHSGRTTKKGPQKGRLFCFNPLESGQSFELKTDSTTCPGKGDVSIPSNRGNHSNDEFDMGGNPISGCLNPLESGQSFEPHLTFCPLDRELCLNPLESGQSFERKLDTNCNQDQDRSQSPRIGAIIRTPTKPDSQVAPRLCLNPLESGQSFERYLST